MKSKFIKSTFILIIGGAITKIMAMVIKIFLTRSIGNDGIGLYMLVLPTFNLFIVLGTLSLPTAISKLVAENKRSKKIILPLIPLVILYNIILMFLIIVLAPFVSNNLLHNPDTYYPIMGIGFTLPFIGLSSVLKGYYFGKEKMIPYVVSNIIEQNIRLLFIIFIIPKLMVFGVTKAVLGVVLINVISELMSSISLIILMPKCKIKMDDFKYDKHILKDILNISLNSTGSRLIGSISYFLEPIILTFVLVRAGYTSNYVTMEYGIINGYVFPLLLLPSFFTMAISTSLLPVISRHVNDRNYQYVKNKLYESLGLSFLIGIVFTLVFLLFGDKLLFLIYNTHLGNKYVRVLAPFFLLHYIQGPLTSFLQATNQANVAMRGTLVGAIIKNILLLILPFLYGIVGYIISVLVNILYVTSQHIFYSIRTLRNYKY